MNDDCQTNPKNLAACSVSRRAFISSTVASAAALALEPQPEIFGKPAVPPEGLIDVNVNLSRWPLRRVRYDDTPALAGMLHQKGVAQAWAGSFDGLLHKDLGAVNARLTDECRRYGRGILSPFGSINPRLPDWEEELRRCSEQHRMPGIRLHPNYHGYKFDDPVFSKLLKLASDAGLVVQIVWLMEDERMMHPLLWVPQVEAGPLGAIVKDMPKLKLVLVNAAGKLHGKELTDLVNAGNVFLEISMLEGVGGIVNLLPQITPNRLLFGSYTPLFYFDSALLKLKESPLTSEELNRIRNRNAQSLMRAKD